MVFKKIRKKIAKNELVNKLAASFLTGYVRFCHSTTRWEQSGFDDLYEQLDAGTPVIIVMWHERLFFSTYFFDTKRGKVCAITTKSKMAKLGRLMVEKFNFSSLMVPPKSKQMHLNRQILRRIRHGESIVISPDGTRGPARVAKNFPILWARSAQTPVFCASFSVRYFFRIATWDRAQIALPFNRGVMLIRRWEEKVPSRASEEEIEALRSDLNDALNQITQDSDRAINGTEPLRVIVKSGV